MWLLVQATQWRPAPPADCSAGAPGLPPPRQPMQAPQFGGLQLRPGRLLQAAASEWLASRRCKQCGALAGWSWRCTERVAAAQLGSRMPTNSSCILSLRHRPTQ